MVLRGVNRKLTLKSVTDDHTDQPHVEDALPTHAKVIEVRERDRASVVYKFWQIPTHTKVSIFLLLSILKVNNHHIKKATKATNHASKSSHLTGASLRSNCKFLDILVLFSDLFISQANDPGHGSIINTTNISAGNYSATGNQLN